MILTKPAGIFVGGFISSAIFIAFNLRVFVDVSVGVLDGADFDFNLVKSLKLSVLLF